MTTLAPDSVQASYLGYRLEITERTVSVFDSDGRQLGYFRSLSTARRFIRGYRRAT